MPRISWNDFNGWASRQGNAFGDAVKQAKSGYCSLYRKYPRFITGSSFIDTPMSQFSRGVLDNLCGDEPSGLPPSLNPPFEGGQCEGVDYIYTFSYNTCNGRQYNPAGDSGVVSGKVLGIEARAVDDFNYTIVIITSQGEFPNHSRQNLGYDPLGCTEPMTVQFETLDRTDGLSDDCGNPPKGWEPDDSADPPDSDLNDDVNVDNGGNNYTFPVIYAPVNIDGSVTIDVGGVDVNFDLGGITFNPTDDGSGGIDNRPPGDPSPQDPVSDPKLDDIANDINDVSDKLDDIRRHQDDSPCFDPDFNPDNYDKNERTDQDPKTEDGIDGLTYVLVTLSQLPTESKSQYGEGSPNVYYAGWFEWLVDGLPLPRQPIHFQQSLFKASQKVTGYAYTLTNGAKGSASTYTKKST